MKTCKQCGKNFDRWHIIDGVRRSLGGRSYCLACSPWGKHNVRRINIWQEIDGILHRKCSQCKQFKPANEDVFALKLTEDAKQSDMRIEGTCRHCRSIKSKDNNRNNKLLAIEYKGGKCQDCNGIFIPQVFDFHHLDPKQKDFKLSQKQNARFDTLKSELDKCVLLCANCHRIRHAQSI